MEVVIDKVRPPAGQKTTRKWGSHRWVDGVPGDDSGGDDQLGQAQLVSRQVAKVSGVIADGVQPATDRKIAEK